MKNLIDNINKDFSIYERMVKKKEYEYFMYMLLNTGLVKRK